MSQGSILLESGTNELELIEFYIDELTEEGDVCRGFYGMNVAKVLEIIRHPQVTGVPSKHHEAVLGTFNLRGRVLPLIDLALWLGKKIASPDNLKVIVSEFSGVVTAFLVSGVTRIHRLNWNQVEAPGKHVQVYSNQSVTGVVRFDDRILFILDMEKIITSMDPNMDMAKRTQAMQADLPVVPDASKFTLMVVDDSMAIRRMVMSTLEHSGYKVVGASSGLDAWNKLLEWKKEVAEHEGSILDKVQLVISDIEMPEMDGHALTRQIKEDHSLKILPVVLFSSLITDALRHKGISVGADDQISKPDLPTLTGRVRSIIASKLGL